MATATYSDVLTLAAWNAAMTGMGNVKLVWGSYTGTGVSGPENPNILTFDGAPLLLRIRPMWDFDKEYTLNMQRGYNTAKLPVSTSTSPVDLSCSWFDNYVSWHTTGGNNATFQLNLQGKTYWYFALVGV